MKLVCGVDEAGRIKERHQHKGYSTPEHLSLLRRLGPCEIHRRSFDPVRVFFDKDLFSES